MTYVVVMQRTQHGCGRSHQIYNVADVKQGENPDPDFFTTLLVHVLFQL